MTEHEVATALQGLYAYDRGERSRGIHDERLRQQCRETLKAMPRGSVEIVPRLWLSRLVRELWLSESALSLGYGIEDTMHFLEWLRDEMELPL